MRAWNIFIIGVLLALASGMTGDCLPDPLPPGPGPNPPVEPPEINPPTEPLPPEIVPVDPPPDQPPALNPPPMPVIPTDPPPINPPPVDPPPEVPPADPPPAGPMFPDLLSPCIDGVISAECLVGLSNLLERKFFVFQTQDADGALHRHYLALCATSEYYYAKTVVDGVSAPAQSQLVLSAFVTSAGERIVFETVSTVDADAWLMAPFNVVDAALEITPSLVSPPTEENLQLLNQPLRFILNTDDGGTIYFNGAPALMSLPGELCFAG